MDKSHRFLYLVSDDDDDTGDNEDDNVDYDDRLDINGVRDREFNDELQEIFHLFSNVLFKSYSYSLWPSHASLCHKK